MPNPAPAGDRERSGSSRVLTWEQKFAAIMALGGAHLEMRVPGNWNVIGTGEILRDGMLHGVVGNGATPEAAVEDHWQKIAGVGTVMVLDATQPGRREVRWNGFMWEDVTLRGRRVV